MAAPPAAARPQRTFPWWLVLALVGLDYFSTLAYLPSIAVQAAEAVGYPRQVAPLAALGVVLVTLFGAVPIYAYVVGRSPEGEGATGLLDRVVHGWLGKVLVLVLLGFVATDLVITRTLSLSDASVHITHNPIWRREVAWSAANRETMRSWLPAALQGGFFDFWNEQLVLTVILSVAGFGFWTLLLGGFTRWFLRLAAAVVTVFVVLNLVLLGGALVHVLDHPGLWERWLGEVRPPDAAGGVWVLVAATLFTFPQMALGLSGFELSLAVAPLVAGRGTEADPNRGRVRNTRKLMLATALVMSVLLLASVLATTLLVDDRELGPNGAATHRALAYLAHGGTLRSEAGATLPLCGEVFGSLYDLSTVLILCLAGASVTLGLRDLVPHILTRFGMQMRWAARIGLILHLFNCVILLVTLVFHADVGRQQWAYASSVLAILTGAACAALLDLRRRWRGSHLRPLILAWPALVAAFFLGMAGLTVYLNRSGLAIALLFVAVVVVTGFLSRYLRSLELRFEGFTFADEASRRRWEEVRNLEFQVLVPHRPGHLSLEEQEARVRKQHRLAAEVPIIFLEVTLGDPSDFLNAPLLEVCRDCGREVVRISRCASVAHVLAAVLLEFTHIGRPPEIYFDWSDESPLAANLHFLFLGQGNVPWMVHALIRRAQRDPLKRPRVVIG
jgi:hypothetical protein